MLIEFRNSDAFHHPVHTETPKMKLQRSPRSNSLKNEKPIGILNICIFNRSSLSVIVKDMVVNRRPSRHVKQAKDAAISAFLPAMVLEQIARRNIHDGKTGKLKESPSMKKYSGVILITDISGFVSIAESLATGSRIVCMSLW